MKTARGSANLTLQVGLILPALVTILLNSGTEAWAQIPITPGAGVVIDADGVLRTRKIDAKARTAWLKRQAKSKEGLDEGWAVVSLPRIYARAREAVEAGQPIPPEVRFLDGMTKVQFVALFPDENDLVLAGPREPITGDPDRPVGARTGRPVLRLDDLTVALRTLGPGARRGVFGCSIDLPNDAVSRIGQMASRIGVVTPQSDPARITQVIRDTVGPQQVRLMAIPANTGFANSCIEADYLLKQLALGLYPSPIPAVKSHVAMMRNNEPAYNRYWFSANYEPLGVSPDGLVYEIRGQALKVRVSDSPRDDDSGATASAKRFGDTVTKHFPDLARAMPEFADLWNVTDLGIVAALIGADRLDEKAGWDPAWVLSPSGYPVPKVPTPTSADTLANFKLGSSVLTIAVGGVVLDLRSSIEAREATPQLASQRATRLARPESSEWVRKEPLEN